MAQSAVSFIREGCDMLKEGQVAVDEFREQAEGLVGQVEEIYGTLESLWKWAFSLWEQLFGDKVQKPESTVEVQASPRVEKKASARQADPDPEILQMRVVHEVSQRLGQFFDIQQKIANYYRDLELESLSVYDPDQNNAKKAIERVEVELQMEYLGVQIRETMVYAPKELKNLYSRFLEMYGRIEEEQEFARQQQIMQARYKRAREWRHRNLKIELAMWAVGAMVVWLVLVGMMMQIALLSGLSREWFSLESCV
jgi:hypothetical protein